MDKTVHPDDIIAEWERLGEAISAISALAVTCGPNDLVPTRSELDNLFSLLAREAYRCANLKPHPATD